MSKIRDAVLEEAVSIVKGLKVEYLQELQTIINVLITEKRKSEIFDAAMQMRKIASGVGMLPEELLRIKTTATTNGNGTKSKLAAKYQHPTDATKQWSGHGRKPNWIIEWLEAEGSLEKLEVH